MMKTKMSRKIISVLLSTLMVVTRFSVAAVQPAAADVVAYSQYDSRWKNWTYGEGTIGGTGCGILSSVNAINYVSGISDVPGAVDAIATWAHNINAYNGTWDPSGGSDRTALYPRITAQFGNTYNFQVTNDGTWATVYNDTLKSYISQGGHAAIAHVAYGHFIVLADYDSSDDTFLVLDSAPGDSGNTGNGVAWLSPSQLNRSGNTRMHVDWWCLLETTGGGGGGEDPGSEVKPYLENGELWLNDCNSMDGFGAVGDTEVFVENDSRGLTSTCMRSSNPTSMAAGVGAMAFYDYSGGNFADMTPYSYVRFSMWCGIDYRTSDRQQDYFQVNFVTQVDGSEQDGYNLNIPASMLRQGWNNDFVFRLSDIGKAVDTADWSRITRMRYTWFNISGGESVEFNIDNFVAYNAQTHYFVNNELMLTNCDSTDGWWSGSGEMIPEDDSRGKRSMWLKNDESFKDHPAGVGLMAFMDYSSGHRANISYYNRMRFSMWCSIDYATAGRNNDYFQVNLVTTAEGGEQDGYNIHIPARAIHQGWNNEFVIDLTSLTKSIDAADMTKIDRMRFTWFNMSNGDNVSFNIDDFICYNSDEPPTSFEFGDSDPVNPVDTTKTFTISDCDSLDSWNIYTGDTLTLDRTKKTQGSASLAAQQTGGLGIYYKFPGTTDFSNVNYITFDFIPAAADMAAVADVRVVLSSRDFINEDNTNSNSWNEQFCDLDVSGFKTMTLKANEWNRVTVPMAGRTATEGFDITKVKKLGIQLLSYYTDERPAGTVNYEWVDNVVAVVGEETPAETTVLCTCERDTEDVFDFCGNSHSVVDGALRVNSESTTASFPGRDGLYNMFYCRVGRNYGDSDYTRSYNYYNYAHVEMLVKPENNNTLIVTHGNEQNNMEWQYLSEVGVTGGRWQRVVMPVSSIGSAVQGETSFGLNDVNLMHIAQTGAGSLLVKNIALVTEQYAAARSSAEQAYINAVNAIGTVTSGSKAAIDAAYAKKADALKYINVQTEEFNTASAALDAAQAAYEALGDATAGDLDGDMRITANDALIVLQHTVGKMTLTDAQRRVSDVNKDGKVNAVDALMILQASVGKITLQ